MPRDTLGQLCSDLGIEALRRLCSLELEFHVAVLAYHAFPDLLALRIGEAKLWQGGILPNLGAVAQLDRTLCRPVNATSGQCRTGRGNQKDRAGKNETSPHDSRSFRAS